MSNTNTGGPAFPQKTDMTLSYSGITARDYFAAKAMQAILQSGGKWGKETADSLHFDDDSDFVMNKAMCLAEGAYQMADAMMRTRKA